MLEALNRYRVNCEPDTVSLAPQSRESPKLALIDHPSALYDHRPLWYSAHSEHYIAHIYLGLSMSSQTTLVLQVNSYTRVEAVQ